MSMRKYGPVPAGFEFTLTVRVVDAVPPAVKLNGLEANWQVRPLGATQLKLTCPWKPPPEMICTAKFCELPTVTVALAGDSEPVNVPPVTIICAVAVRVMPLLAPVKVNVYVPA